MAQVLKSPAEIATHVSGMGPLVSTGLGDGWSSVSTAPLPSAPFESLPQHHAVPSVAIAQLAVVPALTAVHVSGMAPAVSTGVGTVLPVVVEARPRCPARRRTRPPSRTARRRRRSHRIGF